MYDTSKLRGRIIEKYGSQNDFARAVRRSISYVSQYMNGKVVLDQKTITEWADSLDIPAEDYVIYFFTKPVHETEHK